ncbi:MAG TPA: hypothetical protein VJN72_09715 [Gaiellales bacterium]|nr:hypothetical protein [Gaiellales bacterium]
MPDKIHVTDPETEALWERYYGLCHAVQTGVLQAMNTMPEQGCDDERGSCGGKHLRTGVNIAMTESGALAGLLVEKGLITEREYVTALVGGMEREVARYEQMLTKHYGGKTEIKLG